MEREKELNEKRRKLMKAGLSLLGGGLGLLTLLKKNALNCGDSCFSGCTALCMRCVGGNAEGPEEELSKL